MPGLCRLWGSVEALQKGQAPDGGLSSEIVQVGGSGVATIPLQRQHSQCLVNLEPKKVQSSRLLSNAIGKATQSTKAKRGGGFVNDLDGM